MMEEKEIVLKSSSTELHQALNLQRKAQQFTDVTLTVNGVSLLAHRNVLSANSSYFSRVLTKLSQCPHPVIVLNELSPQVMSDLLECIYTGQVTIKQKDLEAFVRAAESLKVQLTLPPLATSEPSHEVDKRGCEEATITNRPRSQNGGRKGYQPKRLRISTDSGTFSGSTASFEGHPENVSPDSTSIRSFHSGSHRSPSQASSNEERPPIHEEEDLVKGDADHSAATVTEKNGLPSASSSGHLAAAQSLAWLGASKLGTPTASENLQVAMPSTSVAAKMAPSLPLLSMDIAGQLQKAFWAAKLSQDNPYGAWMNHSASSSFAAAATAASGTPGVPQSMDELSRMAHSASPSALAAAGMLDLSSNAGSHSPLLAVSKAGRASFRGPARGASVLGPNGKPSVTCDVCGKHLADPSSLYRHRKIHSGEKPHQCPYCGRNFIQRYNMTQHIKTHFKERGINSLAANGFKSFNADNGSSPGMERLPDGHDDQDKVYDREDEEEEEVVDGRNDDDEEEEEIEPC